MSCLSSSLIPKVTTGQMEPPVTLLCPRSITIALVASPPNSWSCPPFLCTLQSGETVLYRVKSFLFFAVVMEEYSSSLLTKGGEYSVLSASVACLYHPRSILPYPLIFSPLSLLFSACYVVSTCPYVIDRIKNMFFYFWWRIYA